MWRHLLRGAAAGFDRSISATLFGRSQASRDAASTESLGHKARIMALASMLVEYERPAHFDDAESFFPRPPAARPGLSHVRDQASASGRVEVFDAVWPSGFTPYAAGIAQRYASHPQNQSAAARLFLHEGAPRAAAVMIHGYRWGQYPVEERLWPVSWMLDRGLDVALFVLPFHAVRSASARVALFPSSDPRFTNEGFRQAIHDLRALIGFLRARGAPAVGAMGMSLGAYTTALLSTIDPDLSFAVPMVPLVSIADIARTTGRFVGNEGERRAQHAALDAVHRVVSPLSRPPLIAPERVLIIAGEGDRITPRDHAERLAAHFRAPMHAFVGGHILQFGRSDAFRAVGRLLGSLDLLERHPSK